MSFHGRVLLDCGGPTLVIDAGGKRWRFEDHWYCGPMHTDRNGNEIKSPGPNSPFWAAYSLWVKQGKKVRTEGKSTVCILEKCDE